MVTRRLLLLGFGSAATTAGGELADELPSRCLREVHDLHGFFESWFRGELARSEERFARFTEVIAEGFHIIGPNGRMTERESLVEGVWRAHGSWRIEGIPDGRIWIERPGVLQREGEVALVTYEEWQERREEASGRLSTAVFRRRPTTPNGVEWLHVHETWLPAPEG